MDGIFAIQWFLCTIGLQRRFRQGQEMGKDKNSEEGAAWTTLSGMRKTVVNQKLLTSSTEFDEGWSLAWK